MKKLSFLLLILLLPLVAKAHDIEVKNTQGVMIYYVWINNNTELAVSYRGSDCSSYDNEYSGVVFIPNSVIYNGNTYSVTSIGDYAFFGCSTYLSSITIPNSVTSIGDYAFSECSRLLSITIPNSVTSIGRYAFEDCSGLTSVTLPSSVTSIDDNVFYGCSSLSSITIPNNVTSICRYAFYGCSSLTSISIPNSVTSIGLDAFARCSSLTSITIPNSVTSIGGAAFFGCSSLTSIEVGSGNTKFDSRNNCNAIIETASNTLITGCKNTVIPNSVTSIGNAAFAGCSSLTSITIPNSVTSIDLTAFKDCLGLTSITIPNSVTNIGSYAFEGCSGLTSIIIPNSVTSISHSAFYDCSSLTSVTVDINTPLAIDENTFSHRSNATLFVPVGSKAAYKTAKYWNEFKEIVEIASYIIDFADANVKALCVANWDTDGDGEISVVEAVKVTNLESVFKNNKNISSFEELRFFTGLTSINANAFEGCSGLTSVTMPNSVTSIGGGAFEWCSGLISVTIPNRVTSIGQLAFYGCSGLTTIVVESGNSKYDSRNDCNAIIETATNTLIFGCMNTIIPNSVTSISGNAFGYCSGLTFVKIPNSVTSIGSFAFRFCSGLTSVTIGNGVTSIGQQTFQGCTSLTSVTIPNSVTSIVWGAFYGCSGLTSVTIGNGVTSIEEMTFQDCSGLISVTIPHSVTSIGADAFLGCSSLTSVTIPNSVTSIEDYAFYDCSTLTSVIVENEIPLQIDPYVFSNRANATLYVPVGCKAAYEAADYWKDFKKIVESEDEIIPTDISTLADAIYVEPLKGSAGSDVNIEVKLKNANTATSYGFELVLPAGVTISTSTDGDFDDAVTKSTRHKGHTLTTNKLANNTYKVGVASLNSKALTDNDGLVLTIKAHVADNMAVGEYPIIIQNPLIVNTDGTKPAVQNTQSKITIEDYTKGDVDGDGVVDLADAVLVINHYVGKPVAKFNEKPADVDGDGVIDLADAVRIINFYVGKVQSLAPSISIDGLDPQ